MSNAKHTVCILTAGQGSRMEGYCDSLNKALLPIAKKAIISHIIDKFPADTQFVVAVGHRAEQVVTYLKLAHPQHNFEFIEVENYSGLGSGPGHSLLCCKKLLEKPFFFVACDTLWEGNQYLSTEYDWFGVAEVPAECTASYCNFEIDDNEHIISVRDKEQVEGADFKAFIGLCFIKSHELFWRSLTTPGLIRGEHQISNGIHALVDTGAARAKTFNWIDVGDAAKYEHTVRRYENFDFSKFNESIYIVNDKVIKYFADHEISEKRVKRAALNPQVFPSVNAASAGFYSYPLVPGHSLYEACTPKLFRSLLEWLDQKLWVPIETSAAEVSRCCKDFYQQKTNKRLTEYKNKYPDCDRIEIVNEQLVMSSAELLAKVPWELLADGVPVSFHGDLQFDNILFNPSKQEFTLLDWRQDFSGQIEFGDIYYDLAKLYGGLILNYDYIKHNMFCYIEENAQEAYLDYAQRAQAKEYSQELQSYVARRGLNWEKIKLLVPIIFLNMSPLHHYPFDKFLFSLGRLMLDGELRDLSK